MLWLGDSIGYLPDAITQAWVRATGRRFDPNEAPWLAGPVGDARRIGADFFLRAAKSEGRSIRAGRGLLRDASAAFAEDGSAATLDSNVAQFYERTADFGIDAWASWCSCFQPFGVLLAVIFSRRLEQLNVPLDGLETSEGMSSEIVEVAGDTDAERWVAWIRTLKSTGRVVYCGTYSTCTLPSEKGVCLKVSFPLPNGNATVILRPQVRPDGSLVLLSSGERFGDPGFYFVVRRAGTWHARYVRSMRERIHVYVGSGGEVRTDHDLRFAGLTFLQLRYRLVRTAT